MDGEMARALASTAAAAGTAFQQLEDWLIPGTLEPEVQYGANIGYDTGGHNWAFSAIGATLTIEPPPAADIGPAPATIKLLGYTVSDYSVMIGVAIGGGPGSVRYYDEEHPPLESPSGRVFDDISPQVGDSVRIELIHNAEQNVDYGTATVLRKTPAGHLLLHRQVLTSPAPADVVVRHAAVNAVIPNLAVLRTPHHVRLWKYRDIRVRSRNGTRGTLLGPWTVRRLIGTRDGTGATQVVADAVLRQAGSTCSIWLHPTN